MSGAPVLPDQTGGRREPGDSRAASVLRAEGTGEDMVRGVAPRRWSFCSGSQHALVAYGNGGGGALSQVMATNGGAIALYR